MAENLVVNENAVITGRKKVKGKERPTRKVLRRGEIYSSDDPIVKGREHLFRPVETTPAAPSRGGTPRVAGSSGLTSRRTTSWRCR